RMAGELLERFLDLVPARARVVSSTAQGAPVDVPGHRARLVEHDVHVEGLALGLLLGLRALVLVVPPVGPRPRIVEAAAAAAAAAAAGVLVSRVVSPTGAIVSGRRSLATGIGTAVTRSARNDGKRHCRGGKNGLEGRTNGEH